MRVRTQGFSQHSRVVNKVVLLCIVLSLILSSCQATNLATQSLPSPGVPPTTPPIPPTSTLAALSLPIVAQAETNVDPTPEMVSTLSPTSVLDGPVTAVPGGFPAPDITLLFTGVIVPARCVQAAIDARGDANYVYDEVREMISGADLAVGTLNASLSDLSHPTGCVETYVLVGDSRSATAAASAGFDVMSVATNHIKNCNGASCTNYFKQAFLDTLDNLRENGIKPVGAGMNQEGALQPVVVEVQGVRFGFVSLGMIEPLAFAGKYGEGIAALNDQNLKSAIDSARQVADVVIAMPHWGPEDFTDPTEEQLHFARVAVEAGADVVVGNHTHVVQAIQQIDGIDVFYGLGNFIFDQTWDLAHQQGVILLLHFQGKDYTGYELIPTHVDGDGTVHLAGEDEAASIVHRIEAASQKLK